MRTPFWVIGGENNSADLRTVIDGTSEVLGSFSYLHEATLVRRSDANTLQDAEAYIVVSNVNGAAMTEVRQAAACAPAH